MDRIDESADSSGYRPVSRLAVMAAVAGVASSLALLSPMLWMLPLVGAGVAAAALADVAKAGAEKAGRILALAGLALSIGFGAQAMTSAVVARRITDSRARAVVASWLEALRADRLADARAMVSGDVAGVDPGMTPPGGHDHDHDHAHDEQDFAGFLAAPGVAAIRDCGAAAAGQISGTGPDPSATGAWGAVVRLSPCAGGKSVEIAVQLMPTVVREGRGRVERWMITKVDVVP